MKNIGKFMTAIITITLLGLTMACGSSDKTVFESGKHEPGQVGGTHISLTYLVDGDYLVVYTDMDFLSRSALEKGLTIRYLDELQKRGIPNRKEFDKAVAELAAGALTVTETTPFRHVKVEIRSVDKPGGGQQAVRLNTQASTTPAR